MTKVALETAAAGVCFLEARDGGALADFGGDRVIISEGIMPVVCPRRSGYASGR